MVGHRPRRPRGLGVTVGRARGSLNTSRPALAITGAVLVFTSLGCGGSVVEIGSSDAATGSSSGVGVGSSGSGSGGGSGSGPSGCSGATCDGCCTMARSTCPGGTCVLPSSSSSGSSGGGTCTCPGGCCDATGACFAGVIDTLCGGSGGRCTDCTASGQMCDGGTCAPPPPAPTCVGNDASACPVTCIAVVGAPCCKGYGGACGCMIRPEYGTGACQ
jgi:hypothetical protein